MRLFQINSEKQGKEWVNLDAVTLVTYLNGERRPAHLELLLFNGVVRVTDPNEIKEIALILGITIPAS
jgi:hypothetical protein